MNENNYISLSLELHLFFDRIMKEHAIFIEASLPDKDKKIKKIANNFQLEFSNILSKSIALANNNVSENFLTANEMITKNTLTAEEQTANLTGIKIQTDLTINEQTIKAKKQSNSQILREVQRLNNQTMPLLNNYIAFKNQLLNEVLGCKIFTTNYPTMIKHLLEEAKMYYRMLEKMQSGQITSPNEAYQHELFWDDIMKEHAEFIRGLLDPSENNLIDTANQYAKEYQKILTNANENLLSLTNKSLMTTINFRNFQITGEEGIITCKIKSIIIPLLADHLIREANHFLRILKIYQQNIQRTN